MITVERARLAKDNIRKLLNRPVWLCGIGISKNNNDFCVQVQVSKITDEIRKMIPSEMDGVLVIIEQVGSISAVKK